ncbi:hypothetical protein ACO0LB_10170 [Undibacterium sp. SXout7W]|uniref:hypothetical protein n=1 Tax=Undibacterium sp. SXout7W TaxID=3413049 RepID=UPI003BF0F4AF
MKKIFVTLIASLFMVGSAFAAPGPSVQIDGQVFIVTKGQQPIKLALVNVSVISEKNVKLALNEVFLRATKNNALVEKIDALRNSINAEKDKSSPADGGINPFLEMEKMVGICMPLPIGKALQECFKSPEWKSNTPRMKEIQEKYKEEFKIVNSMRRELYSLMKEHREEIENIKNAIVPLLISQSSGPVKTDADGKFAISIPANQKVALVAETSRQVIDSTERYQWAVWASPKKSGKVTVYLANDNLTGTACQECVIMPKLPTYPDKFGAPENLTLQ